MFMQNQLLFQDKPNEPIEVPLEQGSVYYFPGWLDAAAADAYYDKLSDELAWRQDSIKLFGKAVKIPRLQAWYGESHCRYTYSGLTMQPLPFCNTLQTIKKACEITAQSRFNCVLANWYRNGQDSMSYHCDDEPELGFQPVIASVTLGAERAFTFKHKTNTEKHQLVLEHGSLLIMSGDTQQNYLHGIAKSKRVTDPRINLTFRFIEPI